MTSHVNKTLKVNPLNAFGVRRTEFCPPYFETFTMETRFNLSKALNEWIYENCRSRYYIGLTVELSDVVPYKQKIKIGFENPSELSYFIMACPLLKYNK